MIASIATAGQTGWNCATAPGQRLYCPDAALRDCGEGLQNGCHAGDCETLAEFMTDTRLPKPIFLIVHQFNAFALPDGGWNADTNDDVEPIRYRAAAGAR